MGPSAHAFPLVDSTSVFKDDIFKGKVIFCTGGGSGIGRAMTEAVMRHGANAAIVGRNLDRLTQTARELSATGRICVATQADVRQPEALRNAVDQTIRKFGRIDFVVCGAAGNFLAPISAMSENGFRTVMEIDTIGTYNTIKATMHHVRASRGSYIHVSATLHYSGTPYQGHVCAAKAGVDALSAVLAVEEGPHGVRSNVIAPGPIAGTEGARRLALKEPAETKFANPATRLGNVKDIANAAVFLFSDAAAFVTGQVLAVDGGAKCLSFVPYPQAVLDPASVKHLIHSKL